MNKKLKLVVSLAAFATLLVRATVPNNPDPNPGGPHILCYPFRAEGTSGCSIASCYAVLPWVPHQGYRNVATWTCCYDDYSGNYYGQYDYVCTSVSFDVSYGPPNWGCCTNAPAPAGPCPNATCAAVNPYIAPDPG